jgi:DNA (cytosine-5)-methyltransferase 1
MTFGSLFSGIGGLDLGFEMAGLECVWQCEKDEYARRVLAKHWPNVRRHDDVCTFPPETASDWACDVICGGDPCQSNSAAVGGYVSKNANLAGEFIRIIDVIRPRIVVRENPSRVRRGAPSPWWVFRSELERLGYACIPFRLRACCLGAKHQRERVFVLGELPNTDGYGLERWQSEKAWISSESSRSMERMDWPNIPAARGFSSRAGIPDYVDEMRAIGNAVVPQVAQWIGRRLMAVAAKEQA